MRIGWMTVIRYCGRREIDAIQFGSLSKNFSYILFTRRTKKKTVIGNKLERKMRKVLNYLRETLGFYVPRLLNVCYKSLSPSGRPQKLVLADSISDRTTPSFP
jgi:hypothetical protein